MKLPLRWAAACVLVSFAGLGHAEEPAAAPGKSTWDQAANIRDAAERIAKLQRTQGAQAAVNFIDACYRTHSLAETYTAPFEGCIAQDYLLTKTLAQIYSRLPPEAREKIKAPSPDALAQAMGRRVVAAFSRYKVSATDAEAFKKLVDVYGAPIFLSIVFPDAAKEKGAPSPDGGKDKKSDK